ncbi:MAG: hypothetical protein J6038_00395 [Bacilli bacterium]|nr:hypothetical protein [Bacilli bacterium]
MKGLARAEFRRTLPYFWPLYLVIPAITCFALTYFMYAVHLPKDNEKVCVFVASASMDSTSLKKQMESSLKEKGAKAAQPIYANPEDASFASKLNVVGFHSADLLLLPESVISTIDIGEVFLPFRPALKENWVSLSSPTYLLKDGLEFGLLLHEKGVEDGLSSTIGFLAEDYYLCLNPISKNLGNLGLFDIPEDKLALEAFSYLLEASLL